MMGQVPFINVLIDRLFMLYFSGRIGPFSANADSWANLGKESNSLICLPSWTGKGGVDLVLGALATDWPEMVESIAGGVEPSANCHTETVRAGRVKLVTGLLPKE